VICVAIAAVARLGLGLLNANLLPFATFFPAVLLATFLGGVAAGVLSVILSAVLGLWMFLPPPFVFTPVSTHDIINVAIFVCVGGIIIWTTEILRRARAQLMKTLEASSELTAIVSYSGDAIIGFGLDGKITNWNASAEQLLGYRADENRPAAEHIGAPGTRRRAETAVSAQQRGRDLEVRNPTHAQVRQAHRRHDLDRADPLVRRHDCRRVGDFPRHHRPQAARAASQLRAA
jgi:PAS domain S-box-containing protein